MEQDNLITKHIITPETMADFLAFQSDSGASANMIRRFSCTVRALYDYLPEDKTVTRDSLLNWRKSMEDSGYASQTILNYVKYINKYLDFVGCSELRFNRGKAKDITGMTFGYLTAIEPTDKRDRKNVVWRCQCKCGKMVEITATCLLLGNTKSCGCILTEHLQRANKYIDHTSLRQALEEREKSTRTPSGYTGVVPKGDKWQAQIYYKGKRHNLGVYSNINDAIKARARGKELVQADALGLLDFYTEIHKSDPLLPSRDSIEKIEFPSASKKINNKPGTAARRSNNTSGYTGVYFRKGKWEARISHQGTLHILGRFDDKEDAIAARKKAELGILV